MIQRTRGSWDKAPCKRCGQQVDTQLNAPLRIAEKLFSDSTPLVYDSTLARRRMQTLDITRDVQESLK